MAALFAQDWFAGIQIWLWRADPTHGGSESDTYSPHGKSAAAVVSKWYTGMPADVASSARLKNDDRAWPAHPRLRLNASGLERIRAHTHPVTGDPMARELLRNLTARADAILSSPIAPS